jgi:hypothetical protein
MPPASKNHRRPVLPVTATAAEASSVEEPAAIDRQNRRRTSIGSETGPVVPIDNTPLHRGVASTP